MKIWFNCTILHASRETKKERDSQKGKERERAVAVQLLSYAAYGAADKKVSFRNDMQVYESACVSFHLES